ncbi:hypothetical protein D9X30_3468 [Cupriavidus sp. U2]|uniref:hypothetical protein n=1 Tax=Cupriavidus sp. U2 TaxID=2920269 RepID=UPI00129DF853|nr:hypothetical protein [Cupriavidus sp. U2]KAI3591643.1 hypothetical protein D9X30_3468 [Cupriavidus sp. U2]
MSSKIMNAQGNPFVLALIDALGLPKHTISFEMRCAVDEVVTIRCAYHPQADAAEGFDARPLLANYKLVPASAVTAGDPAEAFADEGPGGAVKVVQHINLAPGTDAAAIAEVMRQAKDVAVADIKANLARPAVPDPRPFIPQPQPLRDRTAISAAAIGWGVFGMACAGAALAYAFGFLP